jgi:hypothetical protein
MKHIGWFFIDEETAAGEWVGLGQPVTGLIQERQQVTATAADLLSNPEVADRGFCIAVFDSETGAKRVLLRKEPAVAEGRVTPLEIADARLDIVSDALDILREQPSLPAEAQEALSTIEFALAIDSPVIANALVRSRLQDTAGGAGTESE